MNTNDSVEQGGTVIPVPSWVASLVSVLLLAAAYAIYRFLTDGHSY